MDSPDLGRMTEREDDREPVAGGRREFLMHVAVAPVALAAASVAGSVATGTAGKPGLCTKEEGYLERGMPRFLRKAGGERVSGGCCGTPRMPSRRPSWSWSRRGAQSGDETPWRAGCTRSRIASRSTPLEPACFPDGIHSVFINGQAVVDPEGFHPEPRAGRLIRRGQA